MAKSTAESGSVALLDEAAEEDRPPAERIREARPQKPVRAKAEPEDDADEPPFLRARRRVPVRRGLLPAWARSLWGMIALGVSLVMAVGVVLTVVIAVRAFFLHDPRFRIESSASIQTVGNSQLSRSDLLSVFGSDLGRNLFFVPLGKRRKELEQVPWVKQATVMRVLPDQLRVAVVERTPIAFVMVGGRVELADADGVILTLTPQQMAAKHYSFPVVSGINPGDPLSVRAARMQMYRNFIGELDATGEHLSAQLSEVNLSDPEDLRATVPVNGSDLVLHFGDEDFLPRWRNYQAHIAQWQQQYPHLASIDLRYDREVVLKMAGETAAHTGAGSAPGAATNAAGTKPAEAPKPAPAAIQARPKKPVAHKAAAGHRGTAHTSKAARHSAPAKKHGAPDKSHANRRAA